METQIMFFRNAKMVISMTHPDFVWEMPANFPIEEAEKFMKKNMSLLRERHSSSGLKLAEDILKMLGELREPQLANNTNLKRYEAIIKK